MHSELIKFLRCFLNFNSAGLSQVDVLYRSILSNKFFCQGWGPPRRMQRLLDFQRLVSNRVDCNFLVDRHHPVAITSTKHEKHFTIFQGELKSPVIEHMPDFYPSQCETAHFEFCVPNVWKSDDMPVCIHMSGTGDHYYWRRRLLLAKPLVHQGVASLLMENPFYGSRKPANQKRSYLNYVDNIFLMGAGLILESIAILRWLEGEGYGPFCLTGISMGGHMASLAATNWPKPIAVVPCLSWSSASGVFTRGVMSKVVNWDKLVEQLNAEPEFKKVMEQKLCNLPWVLTEEYSTTNPVKTQELQKDLPPEEPIQIGWNQSFKENKEERDEIVRQKLLFRVIDKLGLEKVFREVLNPPEKKPFVLSGQNNQEIDLISYLGAYEPSFGAVDFMRRLMDHFTHLSNFEKPVDPSLAIVVTARSDAYVLRDGVKCIQDIWPGSTVRYVDAGHILAYVRHQNDFMQAIVDALDQYRLKYNTDGTPKIIAGK